MGLGGSRLVFHKDPLCSPVQGLRWDRFQQHGPGLGWCRQFGEGGGSKQAADSAALADEHHAVAAFEWAAERSAHFQGQDRAKIAPGRASIVPNTDPIGSPMQKQNSKNKDTHAIYCPNSAFFVGFLAACLRDSAIDVPGDSQPGALTNLL